MKFLIGALALFSLSSATHVMAAGCPKNWQYSTEHAMCYYQAKATCPQGQVLDGINCVKHSPIKCPAKTEARVVSDDVTACVGLLQMSCPENATLIPKSGRCHLYQRTTCKNQSGVVDSRGFRKGRDKCVNPQNEKQLYDVTCASGFRYVSDAKGDYKDAPVQLYFKFAAGRTDVDICVKESNATLTPAQPPKRVLGDSINIHRN